MRFYLRRRELWAALLAVALVAFPTAAVFRSSWADPPRTSDEDDAPEEEVAEPAEENVEEPVEENAAPPAEESDEVPTDESPGELSEENAEEAKEMPPGEVEDAPVDAPPGEAKDSGDEAATSPKTRDSTRQMEAESDAPDEDAAPVDEASLNGVYPGKSTREEVHTQWGEPAKVEKIAGGVRETYQVEPLGRVKVAIIDNIVDSLAIHLETPIALADMIERLQVGDVEPVDVFNAKGQVLGQSYPERGVLLVFAPKHSKPHVFQVVVEPIDAEPFLARAEVRLHERYADCLADLNRAIHLDPENSRARRLHAELARRAGELDVALRSAQKAVELEPIDSDCRLTLARVLADLGDHREAISQLRAVIDGGNKVAEIAAARAYCLWGNCVAADHDRDFSEALKLHMEAIKLAQRHTASDQVHVRKAAKEILLDAHLAAAHDLGWGRWQQKSKVVPKWLDRAAVFADDLLAHERFSNEVRLRMCQQALAALAGISQPPDALHWVRQLDQLSANLMDEDTDSAYRAHLCWRLGMALADATEIESARGHAPQALEMGKRALAYFEQGDSAGKQLPSHDYMRGRLYYRLGAIFAVERSEHAAAVEWFDQAVPLLESPVPQSALADSARQGEIFVSMAVSYWEAQKRDEALRLTQQGVKLMEQAAEEGLLPRAELAVPYGNLASMHDQLGDKDSARRFAEMAARVDGRSQQ